MLIANVYDMKNISGKRIKLARKNKKISQFQISVALDVDFNIQLDQSDISEIERGVRGVKDFELDAIARVLDVEVNWLLRGES